VPRNILPDQIGLVRMYCNRAGRCQYAADKSPRTFSKNTCKTIELPDVRFGHLLARPRSGMLIA
jgi:hypothetical protein